MYKLLIVDDESEVRNAICNYFPWHEVGFEIISQANNGREALNIIHDNHVDVILCDIKMPVMTGIELASELNNKNIKIIFLSAYRDFEYAQKALDYGVKKYIVKPTKYNELVKVFLEIKEELDRERSIIAPEEPITIDQQGPYINSINEKIISKIKNYVIQNYKDASLEGAAELVHMNASYLSLFFKQKTNQNFSDYAIGIKMENAMEMLKNINYKTYEVSCLVGYSNAKNFSRTFKNYFGKTPKDFRDSFNLD